MAIETFRGKYFALSNMYPLTNWIKSDCDIWVSTSEHAYMSARFADRGVCEDIARARASSEYGGTWREGLAAKERAYQYIESGAVLQVHSEIARIALMKRIVDLKISANPDIRDLLLDTGDEEIYEGNDWGDKFWGVSPVGSRDGENNLGKIFMELRAAERLLG